MSDDARIRALFAQKLPPFDMAWPADMKEQWLCWAECLLAWNPTDPKPKQSSRSEGVCPVA